MEKILFISPSTQDKKTWILTLIFGILPLAFFGWKMVTHPFEFNQWFIPFTIILILLVIGFVAIPYKYILYDTHLVVKRYWRDKWIPLSDIQSILLIPRNEKKTIWRTFGYAGPFGFFGIFTSGKYATLHVFARRYDNWTLVVTNRKKYVIAPNDLQLIDAVVQQIGQAETALQATPNFRQKNWLTVIPIVTTFAVIWLTYLAYKEPIFVSDANAFKMKGIYGVNIPFAEISAADTITWREMPAISARTNGISLFKVNRGKFRTAGGDKIHLSVHRGINPVIRIVDRKGAIYYINCKNEAETRQIFNELQEKIK